MKNKIQNPRVYHYLFSHLPDYRIEKNVLALANKLSAPLINTYQLGKKDSPDTPPSLDLQQLSNFANESATIFLRQFRFQNVLTTELIFSDDDSEVEPPAFFSRLRKANFPNPENQVVLGESTVFCARAKAETGVAQEIARECFQAEVNEKLPLCQFSWGTLYSLTELNSAILLIPEASDLREGDAFLTYHFVILEAIRTQLRFESARSNRLSEENFKIGYEIKHLLPALVKKLGEEKKPLAAAEQMLDRLNLLQSHLYENISDIERALYVLESDTRYFEKYLAALPVRVDILFQPLPDDFRAIKNRISKDLQHTRLLIPGIEKREETIRVKSDLLRQKTLEKNNKLLEYQNSLIAVFAVAIGVGLILPDMNWIFKLLSMVTSGAVTLVVIRSLQPKE